MRSGGLLLLAILMLIASGLDVAMASVFSTETDPASLRKSRLPATPDAVVLRIDLDGDGDPDLIERWWNGTRIRWIDEDDNATTNDVMGDVVNDALQIDKDGDGYYDGPGDLTLKWCDANGDGLPDIQLYNENPKVTQKELFTGSSHFFVSIDLNKSGRFTGMDWEKMAVSFTAYRGLVNWRPNYHGDAIFLKEHMPAWGIEDPRYSWENPFLFWDPDQDGCSEIAMRVTDTREFVGSGKNRVRFDGVADEVWISYDLDNDAARDNEKDYDLTLYFGDGKGLDYRKDKHHFPGLAAPTWALPYFRQSAWRTNDTFFFIPHNQALGRAFAGQWGKAYFTFDEDDDCHRWERVELYLPGNPYVLNRKNPQSVIRHSQADSLGDRGEWDEDFSGGGKLYLAPWDGKMHLLGAEQGAWLVDRGRKYWGATQSNKLSSPQNATKVGEVVQYQDTDKNGFFDRIIYDFDGDQKPELTVDLRALGLNDRCEVIDAGALGWEGLRQAFARLTQTQWESSLRLYRTAFRLGFTDVAMAELTLATGTHEKYENAYWLREEVLRRLLADSSAELKKNILLASFGRDENAMTAIMETVAAKRR